jgi:hypothetical protein
VEFHVHTNAYLLAVGIVLSHNLTRKSDYPVVCAFKFLNKAEQNYNTTDIDVLTMIFALHKFKQYLLGNKFVFYVNHTTLVYLVNEPQVSRKISR